MAARRATPPPAIRAQLAEAGGFAKCDAAFFDGCGQASPPSSIRWSRRLLRISTALPSELSPIEKGVLVIGAWELMHAPEMPYRVAINEAVELAKSYGGTDGHKYVNGVLDKLAARRAQPRSARSRARARAARREAARARRAVR